MRRCPPVGRSASHAGDGTGIVDTKPTPVIHAFPETGYESRVWEVSGNGSFAFGESKQSESSDAKPFRSSLESGVTYLDTIAGYHSGQTWKASFDGSAAVGRLYTGPSYTTGCAVRWTASGVQDLGLPSPTDTFSAAPSVFQQLASRIGNAPQCGTLESMP
jgi:hypothetical protein